MEASGKRDVEVPISHQNPDRRGKWTLCWLCVCVSVAVGDGGVKCAAALESFFWMKGFPLCGWM